MATRFVTERRSNNAAINDLADRFEKHTAAAVVNETDTEADMTAAEFLAGLYINTADGALTINLPAAAALIAAMPNAQVGSQAVLYFRNDGDDTVTFAGTTLDGTETVATGLGQIIVAKVTAATTVTYTVALKVAN